ncbi:hypothetical protein FB451DRAFT_1170276 [Mycena latifolia]|nr:hypothetical protein FB451DRAFT_1170276 [Mycena latifolia]
MSSQTQTQTQHHAPTPPPAKHRRSALRRARPLPCLKIFSHQSPAQHTATRPTRLHPAPPPQHGPYAYDMPRAPYGQRMYIYGPLPGYPPHYAYRPLPGVGMGAGHADERGYDGGTRRGTPRHRHMVTCTHTRGTCSRGSGDSGIEIGSGPGGMGSGMGGTGGGIGGGISGVPVIHSGGQVRFDQSVRTRTELNRTRSSGSRFSKSLNLNLKFGSGFRGQQTLLNAFERVRTPNLMPKTGRNLHQFGRNTRSNNASFLRVPTTCRLRHHDTHKSLQLVGYRHNQELP